MLSLQDRDKLPDKPGIYRVLDGNQNVIYVGQAKNIRGRWKNKKHHKLKPIEEYCKEKKTEAFIDWVLVPKKLLNRVENCAIKFYNPILNELTPPLV